MQANKSPSYPLGQEEIQAPGAQQQTSTGMAGRRCRTRAPPVRALEVLRHDLTTERHEPDEERSSRPDLWGAAAEMPPPTRRRGRLIWICSHEQPGPCPCDAPRGQVRSERQP